MPITRGIRIKLSELSDFIGSDLPDAIDEFKSELMDITESKAVPYAKEYAKRVMPSSGGSYLNSIQWVHEVGSRRIHKNELGILYSDHDWAEAIEKGTRGHSIPKEGDKVVGGVGVRVAKQEAEKRGWKIPPEMSVGIEHEDLSALGVRGVFTPRSDVTISTKRGVYEPKYDDVTGEYLGEKRVGWRPATKTETQRVIAHEVTHALEHYQNPYMWQVNIEKGRRENIQYKALPYEKRAYETRRKAAREVGRIMRGEAKEGVMVIEPKLAKHGARGEKGKIPRASRVPRGTKYGEEVGFAKRVMHPGARPFRIFENTSRFIHRNLHKWMNIALDRVGFR